MMARNYPDVNLYCGHCRKKIETDALGIILVTVALNPELTGAAARGQDFDGTDAALCSFACLSAWALAGPVPIPTRAQLEAVTKFTIGG